MSISKRQGAFGIKYQAVPGTQATAPPTRYLLAESCNIKGEPVQSERINSVTAEALGIVNYGHDVTVDVGGAECSCAEMGYLLWLFMGSDAYATSVHTILPQFNSQYFTLYKDFGAVFATGKYAETGVGCRMDSLAIEQQAKEFAKVSFSGQALRKGDNGTNRVTPAISLAANDAPLSWKAFQAVDGFKLGYNSLTRAEDAAITGVKLNFSRTINPGGVRRGSDQPTSIVESGREITVEWTRDFEGDAAAIAEYAAYLNGTDFISVELKWTVGTNFVKIILPHVRITGDPMPEVGAGDDVQVMTLQAKAFQNASSNVCDITVTDGTTALYSTL